MHSIVADIPVCNTVASLMCPLYIHILNEIWTLSVCKTVYAQRLDSILFFQIQVETHSMCCPYLRRFIHVCLSLCVPGFHATQGLGEGWLPSLLLLRDFNIPSFFTMFKWGGGLPDQDLTSYRVVTGQVNWQGFAQS